MVRRTQGDVDEAQYRLHMCSYIFSRFVISHAGIEREARCLTTMLGQELLQGTALLERSFATLSTYAVELVKLV